ncbi:MAG: MFS transporter [Ruminococcus sp.]
MKEQKLFTPNFTLLLFGQISSLLGNYTLKFALSMYVLEQTGSACVFAALLAVSMIPTILLSPFGGILADRANRRSIMAALDFLSGISVLMAGVIMVFGDDIVTIGALLIVLSVLAALESPTVQACIPQMLSGDNLAKGNAAVSQIQAVSSLLTPFLGSAAYTAFGLMPIIWGAAVCFFLTAVLECFIRLDDQRREREGSVGKMIREDFALSVRFLRREQPDILKLLLLAAFVSLFVAGTAVVGFVFFDFQRPLPLFFTEYGAIMGLFVYLAYYGTKGLQKVTGTRRKRQ